ncbi:MAG: hypothetical protein HQ503_17675 [Rhodospirillales bacterium]|nr:hypothetical protein [Rhodospirillales bacterium]
MKITKFKLAAALTVMPFIVVGWFYSLWLTENTALADEFIGPIGVAEAVLSAK